MAHISTPPISRHEGDLPSIRPVDPPDRRSALAVLLTGRDAPDDPAVDHFLEFIEYQGMTLDGLWAAYDKQSPVASSLIIPGQGRTAVVFLSPVSQGPSISLSAELVRSMVQSQDPKGVRLVQALLDPGQHNERQALSEGGFHYLASLVYMRRSSAVTASEPHAQGPIGLDGQDLRVVSWDPKHRQAFAEAILASYQDTQDCPGLVGTRQIDDIIAGHMAVGRFDPELWSVYCLEDQPIAVMLLNPLVDRPDLELVYIGLAPRVRGRGLAGRLLRTAIAQAASRKYSGLLLAVDEQNAPAVGLYRGLNFRPTARKVAMICTLK